MAKPNRELILKLREAASNIASGADYNWGHVGKCNCGHLVQAITPLNSSQIYKTAQIQKLDEWSEFANDYCPASGLPVDTMIDTLIAAGLEIDDISELEHLSNRKILKELPGGFRYLEKGNKEHAVIYMNTWATLMENEI